MKILFVQDQPESLTAISFSGNYSILHEAALNSIIQCKINIEIAYSSPRIALDAACEKFPRVYTPTAALNPPL